MFLIKSLDGLLKNHHLANIGELLQLRYLSLSGTSITELPEEIGALQYLETLNLWGCGIIQLPITNIYSWTKKTCQPPVSAKLLSQWN